MSVLTSVCRLPCIEVHKVQNREEDLYLIFGSCSNSLQDSYKLALFQNKVIILLELLYCVIVVSQQCCMGCGIEMLFSFYHFSSSHKACFHWPPHTGYQQICYNSGKIVLHSLFSAVIS